jgi:hypothetical protein
MPVLTLATFPILCPQQGRTPSLDLHARMQSDRLGIPSQFQPRTGTSLLAARAWNRRTLTGVFIVCLLLPNLDQPRVEGKRYRYSLRFLSHALQRRQRAGGLTLV